MGAGETDTATVTITAMQWNPHWECFEESVACRSGALQALSRRLSNDTDFANVVELETANFSLPADWQNLSHSCSRDVTTLFFNSARWRLPEVETAGETGCMVTEDRPYVVQMFEHLKENLRVIVVGAHFPHGTIGTTMGESIRAVANATGVDAVVLIADTNINSPHHMWCLGDIQHNHCKSSTDIFKTIGVPHADKSITTALLKTCCRNPPFGYAFEFDRVIANFGTSMATQLHDDPAPTWAAGKFHKGISGRFMVPLSKDTTHVV